MFSGWNRKDNKLPDLSVDELVGRLVSTFQKILYNFISLCGGACAVALTLRGGLCNYSCTFVRHTQAYWMMFK